MTTALPTPITGPVQILGSAPPSILVVQPIMPPSVTPEGTPGKNKLNGTAQDDVLKGLAGDDTLKGCAGQD